MFLEVPMTLTLGLFVLLLIFVSWQWRSRREKKLLNQIPGPPGLPFIGNLMDFQISHEELLPKLIEFNKTYGPVMSFTLLGKSAVFLTDANDIEVIMNSNRNISKSFAYKFLHPWLGLGLLTSTGKKWHSRRKILTPAFHFQNLQDYVPVFNANSAILVEKLRKQTEADHVEIGAFITLCTLDIICETAMGTSVHAQTGKDIEYIRAVKRMGELFQHRHLSFWLHTDFVFHLSSPGREQKKILQVLHSFTEKVIRERRAEYRALKSNSTIPQERKTKRLTFLDLLIEISEKDGSLNDREIREEVDTFMFEGHDTTSAAITWTLFLLGGHPDIQERAYAEMLELFGTDRREPTVADLMNMNYLNNVIKESLRLYPSVPGISRLLDEDVKIRDYTIPAGTNVPMIPFILHRNPETFPEPEQFNPDRFSDEQNVRRHPFAYLPFSGGPRNCIGQKFALLEEKAVISAILRNFKIESLDKRENVKLMIEMILKPKDPLKMKITPRI